MALNHHACGFGICDDAAWRHEAARQRRGLATTADVAAAGGASPELVAWVRDHQARLRAAYNAEMNRRERSAEPVTSSSRPTPARVSEPLGIAAKPFRR